MIMYNMKCIAKLNIIFIYNYLYLRKRNINITKLNRCMIFFFYYGIYNII